MWLSILGIYEYDSTVFDGFEPPSYTDENNIIHTLNRDDVINNILLQCAELEVIYPSPQIMKLAIGVWSASNQRSWEKLYKSMYLEYNPIWNVDALETETETNARDINRNLTGTNNEQLDSSEINSVQGYNSNEWSEAQKTDRNISDNIAIENNESVNDENERINTKRRTGNIGVTASQDLILKERQISEFNIINHITQSFKERFCLLVY